MAAVPARPHPRTVLLPPPLLLALLLAAPAARALTAVDSIGGGSCTSSTSAASQQMPGYASNAFGFAFSTPASGTYSVTSVTVCVRKATSEQSTVKVNKSEDINAGSTGSAPAKKGFGAASASSAPAATVAAPAAPRKGFGFGGMAPKGDA